MGPKLAITVGPDLVDKPKGFGRTFRMRLLVISVSPQGLLGSVGPSIVKLEPFIADPAAEEYERVETSVV
jgi:hypothetical protein